MSKKKNGSPWNPSGLVSLRSSVHRLIEKRIRSIDDRVPCSARLVAGHDQDRIVDGVCEDFGSAKDPSIAVAWWMLASQEERVAFCDAALWNAIEGSRASTPYRSVRDSAVDRAMNHLEANPEKGNVA